MASINGFASSITGTTGSLNALEPKSGWRVYVCPRGLHVSANGSASPIVADSAAAASRIAVNQWFQVGTDVAKIRQCSAVGGNSFAYSGTAISVTANDRIVVIGTTQPSVTGSSATYTPNTLIYPRDDDASTAVTNSMLTSDANGGYQFWAADNQYDLIVQDNTQAGRDIVKDVIIGRAAGDFIPDTPYTRLVGNTASPWGSVYHAGEIISGITGAAGVTYHSYDTTGGWTQGNLWGLAINNATKVYGDTHGGIFQSWSLPQVFNVKSAKYGAKGDNSTDDTTAIQTALNDAVLSVSGTSGGVVFIPRGTYIINSTLTIPTKVRLIGEGRSATMLKAGGSFVFDGVDDAIVQLGSTTENAHGTRLEDIGVDCNDVAGSMGVFSSRANEISGVHRCVIQRARLYGIYFNTANAANFRISDCEVYMSDNAVVGTAKGIFLSSTTGAMEIDRVTINNYSGSGTNIGVGIHLSHTGGHTVTVSNCHFEGCTIGVRQTGNDAKISCITGNATTTTLFSRDSGTVNTGIEQLLTAGSAVGVSDNVSGFTMNGCMSFIESNGLESLMVLSSITGLTWTIPNPISHSGRMVHTGTRVGSAYTTIVAGTSITLGTGNFFGLSTAPAGTTTVTSINPLVDGLRVTFVQRAGTATFSNVAGLRTAAPVLAPGEVVEFICTGTTWFQCAPKMT